MSTTNANGTYFDCGYGLPVGVNITCTGSSCPALDSYPNLVCTSNSLTTNCNNQVSNCPNNAVPDFQSIFNLVQQQNGSADATQDLMIDSHDYEGTDVNGEVSYGPIPSTTSTTIPLPPSSIAVVPTTTSKGTSATAVPTISQSSGNRLLIPRHSHPRLLFELIMIISLFVAQIQAHSPQTLGGSSIFVTGSAIVYPLIWSLLSVGVQSQCSGLGSYLNVRSFQELLSLLGSYS
jgi:hypothetical protein